jgi:hypothetical protein
MLLLRYRIGSRGSHLKDSRCRKVLFQFLEYSTLVGSLDPVSGDQNNTARKDPPAQQAETFPDHPSGPVPFYGEQAELPAAYDSALGKLAFAGRNGNRHKRTGTAEWRTFQAFKLRFALQFGAFTQA